MIKQEETEVYYRIDDRGPLQRMVDWLFRRDPPETGFYWRGKYDATRPARFVGAHSSTPPQLDDADDD